jgi:hypothetical protein
MSSTPQGVPLTELLVRSGAIIRGRDRADCPRCKRPRAVSFDESKGVYHCHGAACDFSGGIAKLARELGLARALSRQEREQLDREHEEADRAARTVFERVQSERFGLLQRSRALGGADLAAHQPGADQPNTWDWLERVYRERPRILTELTILENCSANDLIRFLTAGPEQRAEIVNAVLMAGGVYDSRARFVEIPL